mmetsp:Transcript_47948/g.94616  ORF Transcript_47948/g.94616 Transcript_47948/m.94616 type:complete len:96 (-) Transcript_47948:326-613(-)
MIRFHFFAPCVERDSAAFIFLRFHLSLRALWLECRSMGGILCLSTSVSCLSVCLLRWDARACALLREEEGETGEACTCVPYNCLALLILEKGDAC